MSDGVMTYEDWLRGCVYHDGRHGYVTLPCDEVLRVADFIERLRADRKTEPMTNADQHTQDVGSVGSVEADRKTEPQTCSVNGRPYSECGRCEHFKCTADEPQTERSGE